MANFAFVSPPFTGHLNPMLALAGELAGRGHRTTFIAQEDVRGQVERAGVAFDAVGASNHPVGSLARVTHRMGQVRGLWGITPVIADMARTTEMLLAELPSVLARLQIDCLITDQLEAAGGLVARRLGMPYVSVANALPINRDPSIPPFFSHWQPDVRQWALQRNKGAQDVADWMMRPHAKVIADYARRSHLGALSTCADCLSPMADLCQIVSAFDFPRPRSATFHYVGPMRGSAQKTMATTLELPPGGPIVFASLGTLFGGRFDLFRSIAAACRDLDVRLIIAHGGRLNEKQVAKLPGNPIVKAFVPQLEILASAALCITHAGMNTVMDAMAANVPALAIPIAYDQPGIAARLKFQGAGTRLMPGRATPTRLSRLIESMLAEPRYQLNVTRIADAIGVAGGVAAAAGIIERVGGCDTYVLPA